MHGSDARSPAYPPGSLHFNGFSFFNAVAFQMLLGAPVILYAKSLGATSLVLGVIAALMPLLNILQLVAARFLHRTGYRRFILAGWRARTVVSLAVAGLPLLPGLDPEARLALLVALLFLFNFLRGVVAGAWLPWLTALVPENVRGRFLSRDQGFMYLGSLSALLLSSWLTAGKVEPLEYAAVFGCGFLAGLVSLWFIKRIPEAESAEERRQSGVPVPWGAMLRFSPFARVLWFNAAYAAVVGSLGVFTVSFLAGRAKYPEGVVLLLTGLSFVGALAGVALTSSRIDLSGGKPWLRRSLALLALSVAAWFAMAAGCLPIGAAFVAAVNFAGGLAGAVFGVANTRILMGSVPVMGRHHFFALFTVVTGMTLAVAPVMWGYVLDLLGSVDFEVSGLSVNRYSIYFSALCLLVLLQLLLIRRLHEGMYAEDGISGVLDGKCPSASP